ncbi:MAG: ABC transporter permease [Saprospiraceae bacterium]
MAEFISEQSTNTKSIWQSIQWLALMAWRDSRRSRNRLMLFASSIVLGIASLVAIDSFSENLQKSINGEAKGLIGADLLLRTRQEGIVDKSLINIMDSLGGERALEVNFVSMAAFPKPQATKLVAVRAIEGNFPFFSEIKTTPVVAAQSYKQGGAKALIDKTLGTQYDIHQGDSIKLGEQMFVIEGEVESAPGQAGITSAVAPIVFISKEYLAATKLAERGSRVNYQYYFRFADPGKNVDADIKPYEKIFKDAKIDVETVEIRKKQIGSAFQNLTNFLGLIGFVALLLGCVGVASAVHIYVKDKRPQVAILRTLGASGMQAFLIILFQIVATAFLAAAVGAALGSAIQYFLPLLLRDFLPIQNVSNDISLVAIGKGLSIGLIVSVLFALMSLLSIRNISPLRVLRASFEEGSANRDLAQWIVYTLIASSIAVFTYTQTHDPKITLGFMSVLGLMFIILAGIAKLLTIVVKRFFPSSWSYVWRQGISNLFRPNNQTLILMVSIGLGAALVMTLSFAQNLLLKQVELSGTGEQPNMILFDIQPSQKEEIKQLVNATQMPLIQEVPIVTMRLEAMDGVNVSQLMADSTVKREDWALEREYRCTYRDTLIGTETILEGSFLNKNKEKKDIIYVSLAERVSDALKAKVGTKLSFNVQGRMFETEVSDIRKVDFARVQTNFFVVFPSGVLEAAPQFHVIVTRTPSSLATLDFQKKLVDKFPNVSAIDLTSILKTVDSILGKVSFVIRFMALFSILTGMVVLVSSVALSKYQRMQESVLLRTLGASRRQVLSINAVEYLMLGALATLTGIILAVGCSWLLSTFVFKIAFQLNWLPALWVFLSVTSLTLIIGMMNSRTVLKLPPLEVLRNELG